MTNSTQDDLEQLSGGTARPQATSRGMYSQASDDDLRGALTGSRGGSFERPRVNGVRRNEGQFASEEVAGDAPLLGEGGESSTEGGADQEVGNPGFESGEEFVEASQEQLAAALSAGESAVSDLRTIPGYEGSEAGEEGSPAVEAPLREAGEAIEQGQESGNEEFFPILAALAPTLLSAIGPKVAKGVLSKLSPRVTRLIRRIPKGPLNTVVKGVAGQAGGKSNFLALIAKLLETSQEASSFDGGESGAEVDESFLQEAAAALEVIIGSDDRVRVTPTTGVPWRRICALRITFPSGATYRGTGFFIGPRAVATAGHCVYLHNQGGWARKVEVIPGSNGSLRPFGQSESSSFRSVSGWVNGKKPASDYGCIILRAGAFSQNLGSFGFAAFDSGKLLAQPAVLAGYPGDKPFAEMWGMSRRIKTVTSSTLIYDIDTMGGQSGAPVYVKRSGQRYVVGIHNYGASSGNSATRITQAVYQRLLGWSQL